MNIKQLTLAVLVSTASFVSAFGIELPEYVPSDYITDVYDFRMSVQTPRIYNNTESLGYRKYQSQTIKGHMCISYSPKVLDDDYSKRPIIWFLDLTNQTHKINGAKIGYSCEVDTYGDMGPMTRVNVIGDNKKNEFNTASVCFYMDAMPDYSKGEDDEDNSLLITLGGKGTTSLKTVYGYEEYQYCSCGKLRTVKRRIVLGKYRYIQSLNGGFGGTLGCGCTAYGHKSPTRVMGALGATESVDDVAAVYGTWSATYNAKLSDGREFED